MKITKLYTFGNKLQVWRVLPSDDKIVIEERDPVKKEVFFSCIKMNNGKSILRRYQFEEKYWIGIEAVSGDLIIFHRFVKPDMPSHQGIIVFDIVSGSVLWETDDYNFLFINENRLYAYRSGFEGKEFFILDLVTGERLVSLGEDSAAVNILKQNSSSEKYFDKFRFPSPAEENDPFYAGIVQKIKQGSAVAGKIDVMKHRNLLLLNYHEVLIDGKLRNRFKAIEIESKRIIFEETLNAASATIMPDSFFMVDDYLLLLKEKVKLIVCSVTD